MDEQTLNQLPRFSWSELQKHISEQKPFETLSPMGTALIRIREYQPLIGLAVHAGHQVREELQLKMAIDEEDRRYEEDYLLDQVISRFPIQMIGLDSRYEYDVNRPSKDAIYLKPFQSWGKKVWNTPPSKDELAISQQKYDEFHELLTFIVSEISTQQGKSLVIDAHAYNHKRPNSTDRLSGFPLFDIGTLVMDKNKYGSALEVFKKELSLLQIPGIENIIKENSIAKGTGAIAKSISEHCPKALPISLEIKKIFWDEQTQRADKALLATLASHLFEVSKKTVEILP